MIMLSDGLVFGKSVVTRTGGTSLSDTKILCLVGTRSSIAVT